MSVPSTELPTLDLDELETVPLCPAVCVGGVEHAELPGILAAWLPGVVHARRREQNQHVHEFIDTTNGSAVRYVLTVTEQGTVGAAVAESGEPGLFDRIVAACTASGHAGEPDPAVLSPSVP